MARPKKKPEYDSDQMAQQLMEAVTDAYLNPPQGTEDDTGQKQEQLSSGAKKDAPAQSKKSERDMQ